MTGPYASFGPATRAWFEQAFPRPTPVQARGWPVLASGRNALLVAPTGSGKTLAAFLAGIDALTRLPAEAPPGVRLLYISPLKALVYDVERNLRAPLAGIRRTAEGLELALRAVQVDVRTGDTPQKLRRQQARTPSDILVTTPESLFLVLGSRAREALRTVETVIVDEVHALAPGKRGAHLALSLERLAELTDAEPQRVGLSATVNPAEEVARFLGGDRPVSVVDVSEAPRLQLEVVVPVPDMESVQAEPPAREGGPILGSLLASEVGTPAAERGIWPAVYPALLERIRAHRSTIVFVNSRGLCERLARRLNELAGEELVHAHHGSVSHQERARIEEDLKSGAVRGIVATSSLELGIDMGAVERVVLVESPGSVARGLQRVGRAGHHVGVASAGSLFPKFRGDLLECAVIAGRMAEGAIEAIRVPRNCLDVLAQQVVAMCCDAPRSPAWLEATVRRAYPYAALSTAALTAVLDMLCGQYPSTDLAALRPRLVWNRAADLVSARRGTPMVSRLNAGTIPDRGNYGVHLGEDGPRIGELDEEMVYETRPGETFVLGASTWRVERITRDRVLVSPAPGEPGRLPFWRGDGPGRPVELGRAIGAFTRALGAMESEAAADWLVEHTVLDAFAARNLAAYVHAQKAHTGCLPTDRAIVVERFRDELGDWRICVLTPFGARVHAPWAMAVQESIGAREGVEVQVMYSDDGIVLRLADSEEPPSVDVLLPDPDAVEEQVTEVLASTALFAGLFRENAVRALLLARREASRRNPLWSQRLKAQGLLATVRRYPGFPIVLETYRQALGDVFDLEGLREILRGIRSRAIRIQEVESASASPFARSLVFAYVAAYIYEQDSPVAERRAQALTLDRALLGELLGQAELRDLIDPTALAELETELQGLEGPWRAQDPDTLHDLLRRLGDLSAREMAARVGGAGERWVEQLVAERRAAPLKVAGEARWVAAEEAGLYRDALGCMPPAGLPERFLAPVEDALVQLLRRYARTRGPFLTASPAVRFGLRPAQVEPVLRALEADGTLLRGEIRPGGNEPEWCDRRVLRQLKRRTLARLRNELAAVDGETLGVFLPAWQGVEGPADGPGHLEAVVARLEGLALPWSLLSNVVLPARVAGFRPEMLDALSATGQVVWIGRGALGARDGQIALYRRDKVAALAPAPREREPLSALHTALWGCLAERGASFLVELEQAAQARVGQIPARELEAALWDLVWAGEVTNDTFAPLRALGGGRRPARPGAVAGGRWALVRPLLVPEVTETERAVARATMLLERYGIVSREAAAAEGLPGGFGAVYTALRAMDEAGRVRRGHFVDGLSGAQFALPGAVDGLRAARPEPDGAPAAERPLRLVAAADPANPYGTLLPWPDTGAGTAGRPRRVPGAWVVLVGGRPVLYVGAGGRRLLTFPGGDDAAADDLERAFTALHDLPRGRRRLLVVERVDGVPVGDSPCRELLRRCGFAADYRGMTAVRTP